MSVRECMKEGSQVAAPDLLTQLHLHTHECTDRRETEKKGVQEHAACCACLLPLGKSNSPMPYTQKFMSASIQGCVFCVQGKAVSSSFLALLSLI